jgi:hypothetical protein
MRILKLLGMIAVFSLLATPAISGDVTMKGCTCTQGDCHSSHANNCCNKRLDDSSLSKICSCPSQVSTFYSADVFDPGYSYFGKGSSRQYARQSPSASFSISGSVGAFSGASPANSGSVGPPDMDVVEYLPPSAKQVFGVLASCGPLTQKDLITMTDLPPRTVRYALSRLKGEDMLEERFYFKDARQSLYSLNMTPPK